MSWFLLFFLSFPLDCEVLLSSAKRLCPSEPWSAECKVAQGAWIASPCSSLPEKREASRDDAANRGRRSLGTGEMMAETWKVIARDNFGRDTVNDRFVYERPTRESAVAAAERLNKQSGPDAQWYYAAVPGTYILYVWEP